VQEMFRIAREKNIIPAFRDDFMAPAG
jgi:hypothetical protein